MKSWRTLVVVIVCTCMVSCGRVGFDPAVADSGRTDATSDAVSDAAPGACATATFSNPPASSFVDEFATGALTDDWVAPDPCADQAGGELTATPLSLGVYCLAHTIATFHLACDNVTVEVPEVTATAVGVQTVIYVEDATGTEQLFLLFEGGTLQLAGTDAGTYDPVQERWWRLRELDGTTFFDTAPDGLTWTTRAQIADPFSFDNVNIALGAGMYKTVAGPGRARFRCYNAPPPCN